MAISIDNAIIDFGTISNIITTLNAHEDQFTAFESEPMLTYTDSATNTSPMSYNVISIKVAGVRVTGNIGDSIPVNFGTTFSTPPVVIATVEASTSSKSTGLIAQILPTGSGAGYTAASLTGTSVVVVDAYNAKNTNQVTVNILAIGQK